MRPELKQAIIKEIKEWIEAIVVAAILAFFIRAFIFEVYKIPSGSMEPTLQIGDRIVVIKYPYGPKIPFTKKHLPALKEPKVGDVVVFVYPEDPTRDFVKRLVGKGGDTIEIKNGFVLRNGAPLTEPKAFRSISYRNMGQYGQEGKVVRVPENSYFVLGDNSASSRDSRYWGFVPKENFIGKVVFRIWPLRRWGKVK